MKGNYNSSEKMACTCSALLVGSGGASPGPEEPSSIHARGGRDGQGGRGTGESQEHGQIGVMSYLSAETQREQAEVTVLRGGQRQSGSMEREQGSLGMVEFEFCHGL